MAKPKNIERRERIRELRWQGQSQTQIAKALGISQQSVSSMEDRMGLPKRDWRGKPKCPIVQARNNAIFEAYESGTKAIALADLHGLELGHIYIIIAAVRNKKKASEANEAG